MKDLLLYLVVVVVCGIIFLPLHMLAIRIGSGTKLITTLNATVVASALVSGCLGWWLLGDGFSSQGARLVACVGGGLTFMGYAVVYTLVGPISVDRSISAHIVQLVYLAPGHRIKEADLFGLYTHADVLEKRFGECIETGIIERQGEELIVTRRGARIAKFYLLLGSVMGTRLWYLDRHRAGAGSKRPQ